MRWAVRYKCNEQRDGDYETYALIDDIANLNPPDNCREITLVRTSVDSVAQAVFQRVEAAKIHPLDRR